MWNPEGESDRSPLRPCFDRRLKLEFHGSRVTSDAGVLAYRELDDALGLTALAGDVLADSRTGKNGWHGVVGLLRQSVYGRLAGYEDVNDADRLGRDPASEEEMLSRYGDLYNVVRSLPSKQNVDFDPTLRKYLARYIHEIKQTIVATPKWPEDRVKHHVDSVEVGSARVFLLRNLQRKEKETFSATIEIAKLRDGWERKVQIDQRTNAGMGKFTIE